MKAELFWGKYPATAWQCRRQDNVVTRYDKAGQCRDSNVIMRWIDPSASTRWPCDFILSRPRHINRAKLLTTTARPHNIWNILGLEGETLGNNLISVGPTWYAGRSFGSKHSVFKSRDLEIMGERIKTGFPVLGFVDLVSFKWREGWIVLCTDKLWSNWNSTKQDISIKSCKKSNTSYAMHSSIG